MAHIHEKMDFIVNVFIVNKNRVLLVHHKKLNMWLPIGGHIELDEDPEQALFREIKEECGLDVKILSNKPPIDDDRVKSLLLPNYMDVHKISNTHKHIGLEYFAVSEDDDVKIAEKEHSDIRWFGEEDLDKKEFDLLENIKFYCREALGAARNFHG